MCILSYKGLKKFSLLARLKGIANKVRTTRWYVSVTSTDTVRMIWLWCILTTKFRASVAVSGSNTWT